MQQLSFARTFFISISPYLLFRHDVSSLLVCGLFLTSAVLLAYFAARRSFVCLLFSIASPLSCWPLSLFVILMMVGL